MAANIGSMNKTIYDDCAFQRQVQDSTSPYQYQMYQGKYENCNKCRADQNKFYQPFDLVDLESELMNITRAQSRCVTHKYNPNCQKSKQCTSTFDPSNPVIYPPEICPIVKHNIKRINHPGNNMPDLDICRK